MWILCSRRDLRRSAWTKSSSIQRMVTLHRRYFVQVHRHRIQSHNSTESTKGHCGELFVHGLPGQDWYEEPWDHYGCLWGMYATFTPIMQCTPSNNNVLVRRYRQTWNYKRQMRRRRRLQTSLLRQVGAFALSNLCNPISLNEDAKSNMEGACR